MKVMKLKPSAIKPNPENPRTIKDENFHKLVQSLKDLPEMADVRPIVINMDNVILGGNMRFRAMVEAGWKEIPVSQVNWDEKKQREFIIKDNVSGGDWDWDELSNSWDLDELEEWGLEVPDLDGNGGVEKEKGEIEFTEELNEEHNYVVLYFNNEVDWLQLESLYPLKSVKALDSKDNYEKVGTGRVVNGADFINALLGNQK